jgi:hypothetical protein
MKPLTKPSWQTWAQFAYDFRERAVKAEAEVARLDALVRVLTEDVQRLHRLASQSERDWLGLRAESNEARVLLRWYVENDDTNETAYNEPWLEKKRAAMKLLGMG